MYNNLKEAVNTVEIFLVSTIIILMEIRDLIRSCMLIFFSEFCLILKDQTGGSRKEKKNTF